MEITSTQRQDHQFHFSGGLLTTKAKLSSLAAIVYYLSLAKHGAPQAGQYQCATSCEVCLFSSKDHDASSSD